MTLPIFPSAVRGLGWPVVRSPENYNIRSESSSGTEVVVRNTRNPIWHWELAYNFIFDDQARIQSGLAPYTDFEVFLGFFLAAGGGAVEFLMTDPRQSSVGPALVGGVPNPAAELQTVTDGTTYFSPIQRNVGGLFMEDITDLNGAITVYANNVLQVLGTDYTVQGPGLTGPGYSFLGLYLEWAAMPAPPVSVQFNYYFRVRFEDDKVSYEEWLNMIHTIGGENAQTSGTLKIRSSRQAGI